VVGVVAPAHVLRRRRTEHPVHDDQGTPVLLQVRLHVLHGGSGGGPEDPVRGQALAVTDVQGVLKPLHAGALIALGQHAVADPGAVGGGGDVVVTEVPVVVVGVAGTRRGDRKSTRLNSSHVKI